MSSKKTINNQKTWNQIQSHRASLEPQSIASLFQSSPNRAETFTLTAANLTLDYSKNQITEETLPLFFDALTQSDLKTKIKSLTCGDTVNTTEQRPALHTALRSKNHGANEHQEVIGAADKKMGAFVKSLYNDEIKGFSGKPIIDIVNLGIGGSDLGPHLVVEALTPYHQDRFNCHFVSNMDAAHLINTLKTLNPETTLFIISSKSFSTLETLTNANTAIDWLKNSAGDDFNISEQLVAITSATEKAKALGITENKIFPMWDWVGGRYSLWSAIGLPIAIAVGMENFNALKSGAEQMDDHFTTAPFEKNMPVILASLGLWYYHFWNANSLAVLPYSHDLRLLPSFLQQLEMESNGKSVSLDGSPIALPTCPVIWGEAGTTGQHSFHQLLHQGSHFIPVDFILPLLSHHDNSEHEKHLVASCLSQSQALMKGISANEVREDLAAQGLEKAEIETLTPHKVVPGNRPSNTITMTKLTPETLGALIALYEHKVYVQSVFWDINAFDQWGVELGKVLGDKIAEALESADASTATLDGSTQQLIKQFKAAKK